MDGYFTKKRIVNYASAEFTNARYNLDLLASEGIEPKGKVLDVGCGFGLLLKRFQDAGAECYGTDISEYAINVCKKYQGITFKVSDCTEIPFDEKFDLITCFGVLGIVEKKKHLSFLRACEAHLKDNGILIATAPNYERPFFMDVLAGRKNLYHNARTAGLWNDLLLWSGLSGKAYPVLRIPKSETVGRNIFLRLGFGDPIVIVAELPHGDKSDIHNLAQLV